MTVFVPSYYGAFACKAGACRHSCCIGWDIAVDPASKARYEQWDSPLGNALRTHMHTDEDGDTYITLDGNGRCPFLNAQGLCEIILQKGDGALCQICADHPRYRSFFSDRVEMGLGACCEEAAALLLSQTEPVRLMPLGEQAALCPNDAESAFFAARERLLAIAQDRTMSIDERLTAVLRAVDKDRAPLSRRALFGVYSSLERLDPAWDAVLAQLLDDRPCAALPAVPAEQWLVYGLYRHTADALQDGRFASRAAMAVYAVRLIAALCREGTLEDIVGLVRAYSAEVEYSADNLEQLIDTF